MMLGMRLLRDGVSDADVRARHGVGISERYAEEVARLLDIGLVEWQAQRLRLTPRGVLVANEVCAAFLS